MHSIIPRFPLLSHVDRKVRLQQQIPTLFRYSTMASIPCTTHLPISSKPLASSLSFSKLESRFLGFTNRVGWLKLTSGIGPSNGSRAKCWFKFGKNGVDAEGAGIYGSQSRDDFDRDDVEQVAAEISCNYGCCGFVSMHVIAILVNGHCFNILGIHR